MLSLSGPTSAPYNPQFKKLQDKWNDISDEAAQALSYDKLVKFDWSNYHGTFLCQHAEEVLQFCHRLLTLGTFE